MYKTLYQLDLYIKGNTDPTELGPDVSAIVLNQIKAGRDIDIQETNDGETINIIAPYHSIEYVIVESTRQQVEDPVDDNCIVDGGDEVVEPGTLIIKNATGRAIVGLEIFISEAIDGQYGDLDFTTAEMVGHPRPEGYLAQSDTDLDFHGTVVATGLPDGANVALAYEGGLFGTVPVVFTLGDGDGGDDGGDSGGGPK